MTTSALEAWVAENTFYCAEMRARISLSGCVARQKARPEQRRGSGYKFNAQWSKADTFCASGDCEMGQSVLVQLRRRRGPQSGRQGEKRAKDSVSVAVGAFSARRDT